MTTAHPADLAHDQRIWYATGFTDETGTVLRVRPITDTLICVELRSDVGDRKIDLYFRPDARIRLAENGERGENAGRPAIATKSSAAAATRKRGGAR